VVAVPRPAVVGVGLTDPPLWPLWLPATGAALVVGAGSAEVSGIASAEATTSKRAAVERADGSAATLGSADADTELAGIGAFEDPAVAAVAAVTLAGSRNTT
jgi:hypothetical protein